MLDAAGVPHRRVNRAVRHALPDDLAATADGSAVMECRCQPERLQEVAKISGPVVAKLRGLAQRYAYDGSEARRVAVAVRAVAGLKYGSHQPTPEATCLVGAATVRAADRAGGRAAADCQINTGGFIQ